MRLLIVCRYYIIIILLTCLVSCSLVKAENLIFHITPLANKPSLNLTDIVDDIYLLPGSAYDSPGTLKIDHESIIDFDLGQNKKIQSLSLQADNNDTYFIYASVDNVNWFHLWTVPQVSQQGMQTRNTVLSESQIARYLRIRVGAGDGYYSISEFQAFSEIVTFKKSFFKVINLDWLTNSKVMLVKELLLFLATLLLTAIIVMQPKSEGIFKYLKIFFVVLGFTSFFAWWNFFSFHFPNYTHIWDTYHYYVGSKYYPELGYTNLYNCSLQADKEQNITSAIKGRKIRNLSNNEIQNSESINSKKCLEFFTATRWQEFKTDISWFRQNLGDKRWEESQLDHGYNATPTWTLLGYSLSNLISSQNNNIILLTVLDSILLVIMWVIVFYVFGSVPTSAALIFWGTNYPARFFWTGGAFLRHDWLVYLVIAICALYKNRPRLAGFLLAYSSLLRIFPTAFFLPCIFRIIITSIKTRKLTISKHEKQFLLSAFITAILFIAIPQLYFNSKGDWQEFYANAKKHIATPLTNNMGIKTVFAYSTKHRAKLTNEPWADDPFQLWKMQRNKINNFQKLSYYLCCIIILSLVAYISCKVQLWQVVCLGVFVIPLFSELTCYYYTFLICLALLAKDLLPISLALIIFSYLSNITARWWTWYDEIFASISLLLLLLFCFSLTYLMFKLKNKPILIK